MALIHPRSVLAKTSPHILSPEKFALHIGTFFVSKYAHIHKVHVTVNQLRWSRISVDGKEHKHSFYRDGDDKRVVKVVVCPQFFFRDPIK